MAPEREHRVTDQRLAMQERINEIRRASFEGSRRGYDRSQVRRYLEAVAEWLEGLGLGDADRGEMRRELAWVGERTSEILTKAEETASEMRENATAEAERTRDEADSHAKRLRSEAEKEARRSREDASTEAEEKVAAAERRAEGILEEASRRRQDLQALIGDLLVRRDEIVADGVRLADELSELFGTAIDLPEEEDEEQGDVEGAGKTGSPTRRFAPEDLDEGDRYDEDGVRVPLSDEEGPEPVATPEPGETVESRALDADAVEGPDTEEHSPAR